MCSLMGGHLCPPKQSIGRSGEVIYSNNIPHVVWTQLLNTTAILGMDFLCQLTSFCQPNIPQLSNSRRRAESYSDSHDCAYYFKKVRAKQTWLPVLLLFAAVINSNVFFSYRFSRTECCFMILDKKQKIMIKHTDTHHTWEIKAPLKLRPGASTRWQIKQVIKKTENRLEWNQTDERKMKR